MVPYCSAIILSLIFLGQKVSCEDGNALVKQLFKAGDVCDAPEGAWVPLPEGVRCGSSNCNWPLQWCVISKGDVVPSFKCVNVPEPCQKAMGVSYDTAPPSPPPSPEFDNSATEAQGRPYEFCEDIHELCCHWAKNGECDKNIYFMRVACQKSCGTCGCTIDRADRCQVRVKAGYCRTGGGQYYMDDKGVQMKQGGCKEMSGCDQKPPPCGKQMGGGCGGEQQQWTPPCQSGAMLGGGCGGQKPPPPKPMGNGCGSSCGGQAHTGPAQSPTLPEKECDKPPCKKGY